MLVCAALVTERLKKLKITRLMTLKITLLRVLAKYEVPFLAANLG